MAPSPEGKEILDYGCGMGDFHAFLKERGVNVDYTGTDINPELIALASKKHPECSFRVFDVEEEELDEEFDYVFLCGVFNNRVEGAAETLKSVIKRLFRNTREGLAVTALSSLSPEKDVELNYVSPGELLNFALKEITPYAVLRQDRVPYDFTLFLYRQPTAAANGDRA
jgi:ubiquinone/menaquinone biosynthesis C-methylase UbiE